MLIKLIKSSGANIVTETAVAAVPTNRNEHVIRTVIIDNDHDLFSGLTQKSSFITGSFYEYIISFVMRYGARRYYLRRPTFVMFRAVLYSTNHKEGRRFTLR